MSTKELASAKGVVEPGITMPSPGGSEIEDVRVECVVENDLQLLNKSLEEPSSWSGKYARHKCSTPTRSSYKCPEKRDLPVSDDSFLIWTSSETLSYLLLLVVYHLLSVSLPNLG